MIAENKQEFFEQLERELERLGVEDSTELMSDLEEHFTESEWRGVPESETCRELGSIAEIARSCLDIKSTAINSMVARDVERKKGVNLTKPGRSMPADPTLASNAHEDAVDEDCVRLYTPKHIREEEIPSAPQSAESVGGAWAESSKGAKSSTSGANGGATSGSATPQSAECAQSAEKCGVFERIGRTVDAACDRAGEAVNKAWTKAEKTINKKTNETEQWFHPSNSYRKNVNNRRGGEIPPQYQKAQTKGGGKFVDTTGLTPNVNGGRLKDEIILDVLLWFWLIPALFALALAAFAVALGLVVLGVVSIRGDLDFAPFHFAMRLLFALGFFNLAGFVLCIAPKIFKGAVSLVKHVFGRHLKAIYDI